MSRVCLFTNRTKLSGNKRSHALNATKRSWNLNLQKATIVVDGKKIKIKASVKALRTLRRSKNNKKTEKKDVLNHN